MVNWVTKLKDKLRRKKDPTGDMEAAVIAIEVTIVRHRERLEQAETRINELHEKAIEEVRAKNKSAARLSLAIKKVVNEEAATLRDQIFKLENCKSEINKAIYSLALAKATKLTSTSMKKACKSLKDAMKVIEDLNEQKEAIGEINQMIAPSSNVDQVSVEDELDLLVKEDDCDISFEDELRLLMEGEEVKKLQIQDKEKRLESKTHIQHVNESRAEPKQEIQEERELVKTDKRPELC